jgi:hypothetical protein
MTFYGVEIEINTVINQAKYLNYKNIDLSPYGVVYEYSTMEFEQFNRNVRYVWISQYFKEDLDEVRLFATQWMINYHRPQMALGGLTPKQRLAMAA